VVEESDGDLMGDGVNIAARLEGIAEPGAICLSKDAYRHVKTRLDLAVSDLGPTKLKNIAEPVRVFSLEVGKPAQAKPVEPVKHLMRMKRPTLASIVAGVVALIGIVAVGGWYLGTGQKQVVIANVPAHLSIVVLPFRNLSDDGETGAHLWADRFEESITDLFKLQDQVVARLANTLGYELVKAEAQRGTHSTNPDAIDLTMHGWAALWQPVTNESITSARDYFERALNLDPQYAEAMVGLAYARLRASVYGWSTAVEDKPAAQMDLLTKATAINPGYAFAYYMKSIVLLYAKEYPEALAAAETEVALDPNSAYGYAARAGGSLARTLRTIYRTHQTGLRPKPPRSLKRHLVRLPGPCRSLPGSA
jgi:adenylate cyclase